ncbi:MAG: hypothetical protein Unbinned7015contig1001_38 [Prokaryotic dsDNA virus sp.]|nr:MAG: hypothetical protein Unbinned7015contig1001_38 [Prokaryotic dsDNA virus sp.]
MSARDKVLEQAGSVISAWRRTPTDLIPSHLESAIADLRNAVELMNQESYSRSSNPETSSQGPKMPRLNQSRRQVLMTLRLRPLTDIELVQAMDSKMSASGARSRRSELVRMGLVQDSGKRRKSSSGRTHVVWQVV